MPTLAETPPSDPSLRRDIHIHTDSLSIGKLTSLIMIQILIARHIICALNFNEELDLAAK